MLNNAKLVGKLSGGKFARGATVFHNTATIIGTDGRQTGGGGDGGGGGGDGGGGGRGWEGGGHNGGGRWRSIQAESDAEAQPWVGKMVLDLFQQCYRGAGQQAAQELTGTDDAKLPPGTATEELCAKLWQKVGLTNQETPQGQHRQMQLVYDLAMTDKQYREALRQYWKLIRTVSAQRHSRENQS